MCWLSRRLLGSACDDFWRPGCCGEDSGHYHSSCAVLSLFSAVYWLLGILYGCGHWTGALSGGDYTLHRNTNDHLLSRSCFLHLHSTYPFLYCSSTIHFSTSSSFTRFVTRNQLSPGIPIPTPSQCQELHTHTQSNATTPHIHTLTLRTALLCPSKLVPLSLTRSASCIFQWWLLSLSSPLENKGFLCTQDRGREKDGELVSEEEILPSSVVDWAEKKKKGHFTRENYISVGVLALQM